MQYFVLAAPIFALGIALEFWYLRARKPVRVHDALGNISCGVLSELMGFLFKGVGAAAYIGAFEISRQIHLPLSAGSMALLAWLGVDFAYYWAHRAGHRTGLLWAAHSVHHQSESYNLSVALRQTAFGSLFTWPFYLPLAILGVPPFWFAASYAANLLYQFFIHTECVGRLGILETVLNTPSHHRVHHGRNVEYLDRNYAGMLIVWDRLFGTFEPESAPVYYGVTTRFTKLNPWQANLEGMRTLLHEVRGIGLPAIWLPPGSQKVPIYFSAEKGSGAQSESPMHPAPFQLKSRWAPFGNSTKRPALPRAILQLGMITILSAAVLMLFREVPQTVAWGMWAGLVTWLAFFLN